MYIPKHYSNENLEEAFQFMNTYHFGTMISSINDIPTATHLPFTLEKTEGKIILNSHFSKANNQNVSLENKSILTIFSEPHAYISPKFYDKKEKVRKYCLK